MIADFFPVLAHTFSEMRATCHKTLTPLLKLMKATKRPKQMSSH